MGCYVPVLRPISKLMDTVLNCSSILYFSIYYGYISFSVAYKEVGPLESCAPGGKIKTEQECKGAATILGLSTYYGYCYGYGYGCGYGYAAFANNWPGHQSGCIKIIGQYEKKSAKNLVAYNT